MDRQAPPEPKLKIFPTFQDFLQESFKERKFVVTENKGDSNFAARSLGFSSVSSVSLAFRGDQAHVSQQAIIRIAGGEGIEFAGSRTRVVELSSFLSFQVVA